MRLRLFLVATVLGAVPVLGTATPASAQVCLTTTDVGQKEIDCLTCPARALAERILTGRPVFCTL